MVHSVAVLELPKGITAFGVGFNVNKFFGECLPFRTYVCNTLVA
jgi:hypothetical protein